MTRSALIEQLVNTSGDMSVGHEERRSNTACSKGCSDIPIFGGDCEEYEDWYKDLLELRVLPVRKIPHPLEQFGPRS